MSRWERMVSLIWIRRKLASSTLPCPTCNTSPLASSTLPAVMSVMTWRSLYCSAWFDTAYKSSPFLSWRMARRKLPWAVLISSSKRAMGALFEMMTSCKYRWPCVPVKPLFQCFWRWFFWPIFGYRHLGHLSDRWDYNHAYGWQNNAR